MMNNRSFIEYFQEDGFSNVHFAGWKGNTIYFRGLDDETEETIELEVIPQKPEIMVNIRAPFNENKWYPLMTINNED